MADMELVIKIPKALYNNIQNGCGIYPYTLVYEALKNGTPLPKGHGRLIDADALPLHDIDDANYGSNFIRIAPTIIEADSEEKQNEKT